MSFKNLRLWTFAKNKKATFFICAEFGHYKEMERFVGQLVYREPNLIVGRFDVKLFEGNVYELNMKVLPESVRRLNNNLLFKYLPNKSYRVHRHKIWQRK